MRYKLELVSQKLENTNQHVGNSAESGDFQVFRVTRLTTDVGYTPRVELTNAFANASEELRAVFTKVLAQRD